MTLSESQAMDSFDFLGSEDIAASQRYSMASMSEASEGKWAGLTVQCSRLCNVYNYVVRVLILGPLLLCFAHV